MKRLKKMALNTEKRTYEINSDPRILDQFEEFLRAVEYLGNIGASRTFEFGVDGDGAARIKVTRIDKKIDLKQQEVDTNNEIIKNFGLC